MTSEEIAHEEAAEIVEAARIENLYGSNRAAEEHSLDELRDIVHAILEALTPAQRGLILRKLNT